MTTQEYLDAVRAKLGLPSDYALQKPLEVSKQQISRYRNGHDSFSDDVARRVATILDVHPGLVILDAHRERAKTPEDRSVWQEIYQGFRTPLPRAKGARVLNF